MAKCPAGFVTHICQVDCVVSRRLTPFWPYYEMGMADCHIPGSLTWICGRSCPNSLWHSKSAVSSTVASVSVAFTMTFDVHGGEYRRLSAIGRRAVEWGEFELVGRLRRIWIKNSARRRAFVALRLCRLVRAVVARNWSAACSILEWMEIAVATDVAEHVRPMYEVRWASKVDVWVSWQLSQCRTTLASSRRVTTYKFRAKTLLGPYVDSCWVRTRRL